MVVILILVVGDGMRKNCAVFVDIRFDLGKRVLVSNFLKFRG